mmetsp:Transcript_52093/g.107710  ORF Transcript_52093/g.107710 Transcript_52093/m.107710 type:complete len:729 (+) Transcript_52093:60-2246(+)
MFRRPRLVGLGLGLSLSLAQCEDIRGKNDTTTQRNTSLLHSLLKNGSVNALDDHSMSPLLHAAKSNQTHLVSDLVELRADPNLRTPDGWSALMAAGQFGTAAMVKVLVLAKADLNLQMKNGWCAVIAAAQFGTTAMVQELVAAKANVNLQTENGWSALMAAALGGNAEMVQDLIDGKADVNQQTHTGSTALMMTAVSGNVASARELLDAHADPDLTEFSGFSPLMVAADNNHLKMAHVLVDRGARTELVARTGQSAMQVAMAKDYEDLVRYLRTVTPVGWGLTRTILQTSEFWYHIVGGLAAGAVAGSAIYTFTHQEDISVKSQSAWSGSCRLALKTVAGSQVLGQAFRCLEVIACIIMPLGVAMMWIDAFKFIPLFFLFYVLPPLVAGTPIWQPALLLIGAPRGAGCFDRRLPRVLATAVLLTLTAYQTYHCEDQIKFYSKGDMRVEDEMASFPATIMVHFPWLLNRASSMLVCPSFNHMPSAQMNVNLPIPLPGLRELFFTYQFMTWILSLLWLLLVVLDMAGLLPQASPNLERVLSLAHQIEATRDRKELESLPAAPKPEVGFTCSPCPSGILVNVSVVTADVFLDSMSAFNLLYALQFKFAACLISISTAAFVCELLGGQFAKLQDEARESIRRGVTTDGLYQLLAFERSFEAPLSLCLSAYAWAFSLRSMLAFCTGAASLVLSTYGLATYVHWVVDIGLDEQHGTHYRNLPRLQPRALLLNEK